MPPPLPWLYRFVPDGVPRRGREVLRPLVPISVGGSFLPSPPRLGLIDTGSEHVLAAAWLADLAGVTLDDPDEVRIGIGGQVVDVRFAEVELRLHAPDQPEEVISWQADVGFVPGWMAPFPLVLGQAGFLDHFTATFHRGAAMLAIEPWDAFDDRFGTGAH